MHEDFSAGFRLSPQQEYLWSLPQECGAALYRTQGVMRLTGALDLPQLLLALQSLIKRHEILRTNFCRVADIELPLQVIRTHAAPALMQQDVSHLDGPAQEATIAAALRELRTQPLDLEQDALVHFALLKLSDAEHRLLVSMPALCGDAEALRSLARELRCLYDGDEAEDELAPEPLQYADIAAWQNELLDGEDGALAVSYWQRKELNYEHDLQALFEKAVEEDAPSVEESATQTIGRAERDALESLATAQQTSLANLLLTCWCSLWFRLTGQERVVIGKTGDGRSYDELTEALGLFAKVLPVEVETTHGTPWLALLSETTHAVAEAEKWQDGFTWRSHAADSSTAVESLPIGFAYERELCLTGKRGADFSLVEVYAQIAPFKVKLSCFERQGTLELTFHYDARRFAPADIVRLGQQFRQLLCSVLTDPQQSLSDFEIVPEPEKQDLLAQLNQAAVSGATDICVHRLFEAQAAHFAEQVAVSFEDESLTYGELNARANRLAHYLRPKLTAAENIVGLCAERSVDLIVGMLAILKAGAAYAPIEPDLPQERLALLLEDLSAAVLLTQASLVNRLPESRPEIVLLDAEAAPYASASAANPAAQVNPQSLAYIIYTSGSTGRPKGVAVEHRQLANYTQAIQSRLALPSGSSYALVSTFAADLGHTVIFPALCGGGHLHIISHERATDPAALSDYFQQHRIDCLKIVPSHLAALMMMARPEQVLPHQSLVLGGEALSWELLEKVRAAAPACEVFNHYGPTETTVGVLAHSASTEPRNSFSATVPLGRPLSGVQAYLLDSQLRPVPRGVVGEVYLGGVCVTRGYLNHPHVTAEKFIPHPFSAQPGARLYRTGDLARQLPGGELSFIGRADNQVKIRGFRVEPGEIEATLRQHSAVQEARLMVQEKVAGEKTLAAYVVPDSVTALTTHRLLNSQRSGRLAGRHRYELPNGMIIFQNSKRETDFTFQQIFDEQVYLKHDITLRDGDCVVDVGANIGLFSLYAGAKCRDIKLYTIEPSPPIFDLLELNLHLYQPDATLLNCGLSSKAGAATFTHYPHLSLMSGLFADLKEELDTVRAYEQQASGEKTIASGADKNLLDEVIAERLESVQYVCQLQTLSDIIREQGIERIDLLKIDVQKAELDVLEGIKPQDWPKIRQIVMEAHDLNGSIKRIASLLGEHGFAFVMEQENALAHTNLYNIFAVRPELAATRLSNEEQNSHQPPRPEWIKPQELQQELRQFLQEHLPEQMLPSELILVPSIPLTPNGKVDYAALAQHEALTDVAETNYVEPQNEIEKILAQVWQEVLQVERVGIHDNFFELGGDSILSIQVIARAARHGLRFTPRQLFQHQSISALAPRAQASASILAQQGAVTGDVPLTPIQHWFLDQQRPNPDHFNQALLLTARRRLNPALLEPLMQHIVAHHDALRLRFTRDEQGQWRQFNAASETSRLTSFHDLSKSESPATALAAIADQWQRSLSLAEGPILHAALFELREGEPQRLLLLVHHLAVDGVSWRILLEDLERGYQQLAEGQEQVELGAKSSSFKQWAEQLERYADSAEVSQQSQYWQEVMESGEGVVPVEDEPVENLAGGVRQVRMELDEELTQGLLQEVARLYQTQINESLLSCLGRALWRWTGAKRWVVTLEGHGREEQIASGTGEVSLARTVGWFTTSYPVRLSVGGEIAEDLEWMKEELRRVPEHGIGYGLLRHLRGEMRPSPQEPEIVFNYLGQFDQVLEGESLWGASGGSVGAMRDERDVRGALLDINGSIAQGRLEMSWGYGEGVMRRERVEELAELYREEVSLLVEHCREVESLGIGSRYTPSDFPLAELLPADLDEVLAQLDEV